MWICMNDSFLSAVENRDDTDTLMVRARDFEHLAVVFPNRIADIYSVKNSDYAYRIVVSKEDFANLIADEIRGINYDNFKNSVKDKTLKSFYMKVWHAGLWVIQGGWKPVR